MKYILFLSAMVVFSLKALAGGRACVATSITDPEEKVGFRIDWEPGGTAVSFDAAIAWDPDALEFEVVFSGDVRDQHLVAARSLGGSKQLIELHFENYHMKKGSLYAGDLLLPMNRLGKFKEYKVECL